MAADGNSLLMKAFPRNMCTRVRSVAEWTRVGGDVSVSLSEIAIINLAAYKSNEGSALLVVSCEMLVYGSSHRCVVVPASMLLRMRRRYRDV
jgi:hypothetical protein